LQNFKKKIFSILTVSNEKFTLSWFFDLFIITLIILNVIAIILESVDSIQNEFHSVFNFFEVFTIIVFTIEYILRVWTANLIPEYSKSFVGNIRYALTPLALIDLLAFLPFYLPFIGIDLRMIRVLRLFRLFRLLKITRYINAISLINSVFRKKKEELIISILLTLFLMLLSSSLMYYIENEAQPQNFSSIPKTMWWGISTLTTVGYGDIYPITPLGQFLGGVIAIIGVALFALPTGILAAGFSEEISVRNKNSKICPTCGKHNESYVSE
jgi:voltage-gated potassium channel